MLKHLHIKHFTIITEHELELYPGLTVLTGETGAGKSILLDALGIVLGERADSRLIQNGHERCEVTATFEIDNLPEVQQWLLDSDFDDEKDCLIRRIINRDGRSRNMINGRPCTVQQVRELATLLVHIHGQNQHSLLVKTDYQRQLLDHFADHDDLYQSVRTLYNNWRQLHQEQSASQQAYSDQSAQLELLNFQLQEFEQLGLGEGELAALEQEQQCLAHAEQWLISCRQVMTLLAEDERSAVLNGLYTASQLLKNFNEANANLAAANELLQQAIIQAEEATALVRQSLNTIEPDPERLAVIDQRLALIQDLARKHRVPPEELLQKHQQLNQQRQQLTTQDERLAALTQQIAEIATQYKIAAEKLTKSRTKAAQQLSTAVTEQMRLLGMQNGQFKVQLSPHDPNNLHPHGNESVEFLVTANAGQPLQPINKVASGGELSRISLAIQVITATALASPTLIFDEVDSGVGGRTAEIVGQQLKKLGTKAQVLCVTHLPQVAAQADQHLYIQKQEKNGAVETMIQPLTAVEKIAEIARMLGGVTITEKTLAHAKEMLRLES
ncbi:MAG TPA: DNA repair protein RecN [Gammaproteobacteria bacterium]|nr:DNA repair protein RecN [Gammaproteobacteria bacterium]